MSKWCANEKGNPRYPASSALYPLEPRRPIHGVDVDTGVAANWLQRPVSVRMSPSRPMRSSRWRGKSSAPSADGERRSAAAVAWSVPGARPIPRSMRPGCSASSMANCSATTSGGWFGNITPPEPTRMRSVRAARCAMSTDGVVLATVRMLWCSATQKRVSPSASARWARAVVSASALGARLSLAHDRRDRAQTALAASPGHGTFGRDGCLLA